MKRLHAIVEGRVQGVNYRTYTQAQAERLHLTGSVGNLPSGAVEIHAEGEDIALAQFVLTLEKGPPLSRVDEVHVTYSSYQGEFAAFNILFTE